MIDVLSAKSSGLESNPLCKSFMYTKKNIGLKSGITLRDLCFDGRPLGRLTIEDYSLVPVSKK